RNFYGERDRDQFFDTQTGVTGLVYEYPVNKSTLFSSTLAVSGESISASHNLVKPAEDANALLDIDGDNRILDYHFKESRISNTLKLTTKDWKRNTFKIGAITDYYRFRYFDRARNILAPVTGNPDFGEWRTRWLSNNRGVLFQPYAEWKHSMNNVDILSGIHS